MVIKALQINVDIILQYILIQSFSCQNKIRDHQHGNQSPANHF